ncbi:hypothetical protein GDI0101 [Gluconacetobacter diazotrophicus PA1 5]|uniref:Uncharacterized protein n=1 Tax=Gluconacetobacter diazotrophicus (strain ATCC 49037 / DSM 5601 / CCUG 37298 / CIP 103539 / LMG 7603 / PAl5) TaxID=272568 RepID=A9H064_GLUDA|nr:hypothetical protein GDI0101 [Gluconacetobacter diazotrophicus PA1 5]
MGGTHGAKARNTLFFAKLRHPDLPLVVGDSGGRRIPALAPCMTAWPCAAFKPSRGGRSQRCGRNPLSCNGITVSLPRCRFRLFRLGRPLHVRCGVDSWIE